MVQTTSLRRWSVLAASVLVFGPAFSRDLTFEERVSAQEAIERVQYSHQIGTTRSFETAVPRATLEAKVRTYLAQSQALETVWHTRITSDMLERETRRMAAGSRMPERLVELYAALGNDPFLVEECLARPALVDRMARSFFAFDSGIHAAERAEAERLRAGLAQDGIASYAKDSRRRDLEIVAVGSDESAPSVGLRS